MHVSHFFITTFGRYEQPRQRMSLGDTTWKVSQIESTFHHSFEEKYFLTCLQWGNQKHRQQSMLQEHPYSLSAVHASPSSRRSLHSIVPKRQRKMGERNALHGFDKRSHQDQSTENLQDWMTDFHFTRKPAFTVNATTKACIRMILRHVPLCAQKYYRPFRVRIMAASLLDHHQHYHSRWKQEAIESVSVCSFVIPSLVLVSKNLVVRDNRDNILRRKPHTLWAQKIWRRLHTVHT